MRHWAAGIAPEAAVGDQHLDEVRVADLQRVGVVDRLGIGKVGVARAVTGPVLIEDVVAVQRDALGSPAPRVVWTAGHFTVAAIDERGGRGEAAISGLRSVVKELQSDLALHVPGGMQRAVRVDCDGEVGHHVGRRRGDRQRKG